MRNACRGKENERMKKFVGWEGRNGFNRHRIGESFFWDVRTLEYEGAAFFRNGGIRCIIRYIP